MNGRVIDVEQRSEAWRESRAGRLTGSCASAILAVRKRGDGELAARRNLRLKLVVERLTGIPEDDLPYLPAAMQHGVDTETTAFRAYEAATGQLVKRVGFIAHRELMAGASPDGYIGEFIGLIELKCPKSQTHFEYLRAGCIPDEYRPQMIHNLWLTEADWCDFVSFDDRFPPHLRLFRQRLHRNGIDFRAYELLVRMFLAEVDKEVDALAEVAA